MTSTRQKGWKKKEPAGKKGPINRLRKLEHQRRVQKEVWKEYGHLTKKRDRFDSEDKGRRVAGPFDRLVRIRDKAYLARRHPNSKGPQYLLHYPRY